MKRTDSYLLTGASGFLGSYILQHLQKDGNIVKAIGSGPGQLKVDMAMSFDLPETYAAGTVIHAAGKAHTVPHSESEKQQFFNVNVQGTKNLCAALEKLSPLPTSFIFISTVAVYGVDQGELISETHTLNGTTPYAMSKIAAEKWLKEWAAKRNILLAILRLPLLVGHNPPGNLGNLRRAIQKGRYVRIGKSEARKSVVCCRDIAAVLPVVKDIGGIFNLTDGRHPRFCEIESAILQQVDKTGIYSIPLSMAKAIGRAGDLLGDKFPLNSEKLKKITSSLTFDDEKARRELGWEPSSALEALKTNS